MAAFTQVGVEAVVKNFTKFNRDLNTMNKTIARTGKGTAQSAKAMNQFGRTVGGIATTALAGIVAGLGRFGASAVKEGAAFQKSMSNVKAVSGALGKDFQALEQQAAKLGATTKFTAIEAAEGMSFLAMAGFETNEIMAAMPGTLNLAAAANLDLGTSADIVSNVLSGFGANAESTGMFVDILTKTFTTSNTSLVQLGQAMKFAGPVAKSLGLSVSDTAAALGIFGNAGIQGSLAGTTLRGVLVSLANPSNKAKDVIQELGIEIFNAKGQMLSLPEIIGNVNEATAGLSEQQRIQALTTIVGTKRLAGFNILLAEGEQELQAYGDKLRDSVGTASTVAAEQLNNLSGDFTLLQSAVSGFKIGTFAALEPALRGATKASTELIVNLTDGLNNWNSVISTTTAILGNLTTETEKQSVATSLLQFHVEGIQDAFAKWLEVKGMAIVGVAELTFGEEKLAEAVSNATGVTQVQTEQEAALVEQTANLTQQYFTLANATQANTDITEQSTAAYTLTASEIEKLTAGYELAANSTELYAETQRITTEIEQERQESLTSLAGTLGDFALGVKDAQQSAIESEQSFNAQISSIRGELATKTTEQGVQLSEKLSEIEQQRQDKIHWVLTGAHARTQAENDAALAHWNQHFDTLVTETTTKAEEQNQVFATKASEREAIAREARAKELEEQKVQLEKLKLNAALATLESTGQLAQFTGGLAVSASEAARLIEAGVLPVTQNLAVAIQGNLAQLTAQSDTAAVQAGTNADLIGQALAGTLTSTVDPALVATQENFDVLSNESIPGMTKGVSEGLMPVIKKTTEETLPLFSEQFTLTNQGIQLGLAEVLFATNEEDLAIQNITTISLPELLASSNTTTSAMVTGFSAAKVATDAERVAIEKITKPTLPNLKTASINTTDAMISAFGKVASKVDSLKGKISSLATKIKGSLVDAIKNATSAAESLAAALERVAAARVKGSNTSQASGGPGFATGTPPQGFLVPSGFPNDTFPINVSSGERVFVTPQGASPRTMNTSITNNNISITVSNGSQGGFASDAQMAQSVRMNLARALT